MIDISDIDPKDYVKLFNIKETPLLAYFEIEKRKDLMKEEGFPNVHMIYVRAQHFFLKKDIERYDLDDDAIRKVIKLVKERSDSLVDVSRKLYQKEYIKEDDVREYFDSLGRFMAVVDIPIYLYPGFEERFYLSLKSLDEKKIEILTHPMYNTYHMRRRKDLIRVKNGEMAVSEFIKLWNWSEMQLFKFKAVDLEFIKDQIENLSDDEGFDEKTFYEFYDSLDESQKEMVDLAQELIRIRDYRIESILKSCFMSVKFLGKYAETMGILYDDIIYMTPSEILGKKIPGDIEKRKTEFAYVNDITTDKDYISSLFELFNRKLDSSSVTGRGVSSGCVKGRAKIVISKDDLAKVEKGDILVCDITTPDYIHAIHRAKAIVANIGGFTSHTAIVAREFAIPAVINCGEATNIFEDDDIIEVDADKGVVRKIG